MDKNIIKKHLTQKFLSEAKGETATPGITVTNAVKKKSGEENKKGVKDMEKELGDYDKDLKKGMETTKVPNKFNYSNNEEVDYHKEVEIMNGQEMIQYDRDPIQEFKDRAEEGIAGSTRMGNNPEWANVIPAQQGFTGPEFGKNLVKSIKASQKLRSKDTPTSKMFGDDWEVTKDESHKPYAFENKNNNKPQIKESMKRLKFKKEFKGVGNALKMIPESYKVDNKVFEMTDGVENYKIRWEGSLTEGRAVVLMASDKNLVNEDMQKMKHLMGYKPQETLGLVKGKSRLDENAKFEDIWKKTRALMESDEELEEGADVKQAAEAKKHVQGSVSTEKGTQAPAPKTGNFDEVKKKAPEATKHVEGSVSTEKGTQAPAPKTGNWDEIKKKAPEATKHVHMSEGLTINGVTFEPINESWMEENDDIMDLEFQRRQKEKQDKLNAASSSNVDTRDIYDLKQDVKEYGDEHGMSTKDAVDSMPLKKEGGVYEYGDEHGMTTKDALDAMAVKKEGMMVNEAFGVSDLLDKAREIANKLLPTLSDEEKQNVMAIGNKITSKLGDPKSIIAKFGGVEQLSPEEDKELTQQAQQVTEGVFGDAMKRWAARFATLVGAPAGFAAAIIGFGATGYNTWGDSAFLTKMHDAIEGAVGQAGGPLSVLLFILSFIMLFIGLMNWNAGKK